MKKLILISLIIPVIIFSGCFSGGDRPLITPKEDVCIDSDGGVDVFVKGTVTRGISKFEDSCSNAEWIKEYYCLDENLGVHDTKCDRGCSNGACIR